MGSVACWDIDHSRVEGPVREMLVPEMKGSDIVPVGSESPVRIYCRQLHPKSGLTPSGRDGLQHDSGIGFAGVTLLWPGAV